MRALGDDHRREYNPLSVDELGRNAARALMTYPPCDLPPDEAFNGAGVYTIHYGGTFAAYANMGEDDPIYVGKADLPGKRQGQAVSRRPAPVLHRRLSQHADSIKNAHNLDLAHFRCRWLILDPVWIGLTEQVLISKYRPIWNVVVDGFGNHDQGTTRRNQRRSRWDTLHPGRPWAAHYQDSVDSADAILTAIGVHRAKGETI